MGKFAKLCGLEKKADGWEQRLAGQEQRLQQHIPSSYDEATTEAQRRLSKLRELAFMAGYQFRSQQQAERGVESLLPDEGATGREHFVQLPAPIPKTATWLEPRYLSKEALLGAVTDPLVQNLEESALDLQSAAESKKQQLTRVTSDPKTLPLFYPSVALGVPKSFVAGHRQADVDLDTKRKTELDTQIEAAKQEFERALADEYTESRKIASAGELIDGLALTHVKSADGELNQMLGWYLAAASLLGEGARVSSRNYVEKHDPRYQRVKALREMIKHRQRLNPPPVLVSPAEMPAAASTPVVEPEPVQELDESADELADKQG
jgi:hypothetical protein